jgi:H+/Cl- antiporter ClcA
MAKKKDKKGKKNPSDKLVGIGLLLGVGIGLLVGEVAAFVLIGLALGMLAAYLMRKK